jgi:UDP-N-acetyl-D-mannosaminuronic acid dehydrogenase
MINRVCVLGLGYIGLPTAAILATSGFDVIGVDTDPAVVTTVANGNVYLEEPGLQVLVSAAHQSGRLTVCEEPEPCDAFLICVPTPLTAEKRADLSYVRAASRSIVPHLRRSNLVVLESTVPPGTTRNVVVPILQQSDVPVATGVTAAEDAVLVVHCPERVIPGKVLHELIENDRVLGGVTPRAAERAQHLYEKFVTGALLLTDATTAEVSKLAENTFRDVNIAFANELAQICEENSVDVWEVIELANHHPRVVLHSPGPGVGGHCISVDPWFLVEAAPKRARLIQLSREINDAQPIHVFDLIQEMVSDIEVPQIALLGVAYKGNVDDTRESPAFSLIQALEDTKFGVRIVDPRAKHFPSPLQPFEEALSGADLVVLLADHDEFVLLEPQRVGSMMRHRRLLDTRNCFDLAAWREAGFKCCLLGGGMWKSDK